MNPSTIVVIASVAIAILPPLHRWLRRRRARWTSQLRAGAAKRTLPAPPPEHRTDPLDHVLAAGETTTVAVLLVHAEARGINPEELAERVTALAHAGALELELLVRPRVEALPALAAAA